jgi:sigma-E factor negative regulatory protein RseC
MSTKISHSGIIERIDDGCVHVRIVQTSACAACKVAGYCNAAESKEKIVDVYRPANGLKVGDAVTVTASATIATQALMLGFALPFVILVGVLVAVLWLTGSEGKAGVSALVALVPYYGVLYMMRDKLRDRFAFEIE